MRRKVAWLLICSLILSLVVPSVMPSVMPERLPGELQSGLMKAYAAESGIHFNGPTELQKVGVGNKFHFGISKGGGAVAANDEVIVLASPSNAGVIKVALSENGTYYDSVSYPFNDAGTADDNKVFVKGESAGKSEVWLKYKKNGEATYKEFKLASVEVSASGSGGYDGPRNPYYTNRNLTCYLEGWENSWDTDNGGSPVSWSLQDGVYNIEINVKPQLWERLYNNIDQAGGIKLGLYLDSPSNTVIGYTRDCRGYGSNEAEDARALMNSVITSVPRDISQNTLQNAVKIDVMKINADADGVVLSPLTEKAFLGTAWFTSYSPKTAYVFAGQGEGVQNFEIVKFRVSHKNTQEVAVSAGSLVDENWLETDEDGTFTSVLLKESYQSGRLTYTLDGDDMDDAKSSYYGKRIVTKVTIPGAQNLAVSVEHTEKDLLTTEIIQGAAPAVLLKMEVRERPQTNAQCRIRYELGGKQYSKLLSLKTVRYYDDVNLEQAGFTPVADTDLRFDPSTTDGANHGFTLEKSGIDSGEVTTVWSGKAVNMSGVQRRLYVKAPTDINVVAYHYWTAEGNISLHDGDVAAMEDLRDHTLLNQTRRTDIQSGEVELKAFYLPVEFDVAGRKLYSLTGRSTGIDETSLCMIAWEYDDQGQTKYRFQYYYAETGEDHTQPTMPQAAHKNSGLPEPELIAVKDAEGTELPAEDYELQVSFYGTATGDYDYYRIRLLNDAGKPADLNGGSAIVKFPLQDADKKWKKIALKHYTDLSHANYAEEDPECREDGIYVTLKSFSPFLLSWDGAETSRFKLNLNSYPDALFLAAAEVKTDSVTYFLNKTYALEHFDELKKGQQGNYAIRMDTGYTAPEGASYANYINGRSEVIRFDVQQGGYIRLDCSAFPDGQGGLREQDCTFPLTWYDAQNRQIGEPETVSLKIRYEELRTVYPEVSTVNMNTGSLPEKLFPGGYYYDEDMGRLEVAISPSEVEKHDFSSGSSSFGVQVKVPDGWTPLPAGDRSSASYDEKTRTMNFGVNLKDRQQNYLYQQMLSAGFASFDASRNFTNTEGKKVALTVHFILRKELATWPANGTVELPEAADYIKSSSYADGVLKLLIYEEKLKTAIDQKAVNEDINALFKVQVPDGVSAQSCQVDGKAVSLVEKGGRKYAPVSSWLATKMDGGMALIGDGIRETFHIDWLDAGGNVLSGSVLTVAIKFAPEGEYRPYQEVDGARVSFALTCWPEGEAQPITVNYSSGKYTVTLDMDQAKWQKAYENRKVGEDGLYLRASITPVANAAYGRTVSSGDFIERQQPEMMMSNVRILESGQSFYRVRGDASFSTVTKIADIVDNGTTATVNPTAWTSHMLTAAWEDQDGDLISLSAGNVTYCEYLRFGTAHKDSKAVQIKTESFKTDGASITLDLENKYDAYEYRPATFVNNSVNYYLDGDELDAALKADASFGTSHSSIKTGFKAPTGAKGYILERANRDRAEEYTFAAGEDKLVLEAQILEGGKYRNIYQDTFAITWVMADGSKVKDNPLAIRATVVWEKNAYDKLSWTRMPANRFVFPDSLTGGYGINVTIPEAGHLNTEFTGGKVDPVFEEIDRDMIEITVPDYGEKILQYETSSWEGANRYSTFENNVQEVIGVNERVDLGSQTTIRFWYGATPTYSTIIENNVERKIWTGASFGRNEDCASYRYVRWYGEGGKVLGTEWFMITADECFTEKITDGQAAVTKAVTEPVLVSGKYDLRVQNYIVGTLGTDAKESLYVRMCPVDEKGFEVHTGKTSVYWPYPEGLSKANAESAGFEVYHYTDALHLFKESVKTEFTDYGIKLTMDSFSPFLMAWTRQETPTPTPTPSPSGDDGGGSVVVIKPDKAVTPITVAADGKQMMGTAAISLVPAKFTAAEKAAYVASGTWSKDAYGYWYLKNAKGETYKSCWVLVSDQLGSKPVGNASWYYLDANGRMLTGWQWIAGADGKKRCYYFNKEDGSMYGACLLGGTTPDHYKLNEKGEWVDEKGNVQVK